MANHTIRTTMRPDQTIAVGEAEYQQLLAEGLVYSGTPPVAPADFYDGIVTSKIQDPTSTTSAALRAAFVAGHVYNSDGSQNTAKTLHVVLTADGTDIQDLIVQ